MPFNSDFEIGDEVYINPPEDWGEFPSWTDSMDEEIDTDLAYVVRWVGNDVIDLVGLPYNFSPHWLELVNEKIILTGAYAQVIKKIKQLDKRFEERKKNLYDLAA
jgi:hypothetical protein